MEPNKEGQAPQKTPEEIITALTAERDDLKVKADASSQNFERLKKAEEELKELRPLKEGKVDTFDSASLEKRVDAKVDLRLAGWSQEQIAEAEAYAKGRGITLTEAAQSPFVKNAVEAMKAQSKSIDTTPASSNKTVTFNGKPVSEIFKSGTPEEKQAAFEARLKGKPNNNE